MSNNNVIRFPATPAQSPCGSDHRIIFKMGRRRFAYDLHAQVTELNPEPAVIMPFTKDKCGKVKCGKKPLAGGRSRRR